MFTNLGRALDAAGARPEQVTRITIYIVGYLRAQQATIEAARVTLFGDHKPTEAMIGVAALSWPEQLIEVDAIAVIDDDSTAPRS